MTIEKKLKLDNDIFYIAVDVEYKKNDDITTLKLKNYKDNYYDSGNFSRLIETIEKNYNKEITQKYDRNISYMSLIIYLYVRIPFLSGIRDICIEDNDNIPTSVGYISKDEIEKYIVENNINIDYNENFKLFDERTWVV